MTTQTRLLAAAMAAGALPMMAGETARESRHARSAAVKIEAVDPFTHFATIPEGADLSSIKFQGVKMVMVATQRRSRVDLLACDESAQRDSAGSISCADSQFESPAPAYQVTYSYLGQPLASDEFGNRNFTFSVYFRPDELGPDVQQQFSRKKMAKSEAASFFSLITSRALIQRSVIDYASSKVCDRNLSDGSWTPSNPGCSDQINYRMANAASDYVTLKVEPVVSSHRPLSTR